jgi:peroxidase
MATISPLLLPLALLALLAASSAAVAQLEIGFYSKTCPQVEEIVREEMVKIIAAAPSLAGPLLRLHFHDCFVNVSCSLVLCRSNFFFYRRSVKCMLT